MEPRAHHVVIGAFAIGVAVLALGFVLWLTRASVDQRYTDYEVVFNESVTGLSRGGMVQYNGITVGEVAQLRLAPDDFRQLLTEHPALYPALLKLGAQRTHRLLEQVQDLKTLDLGQRLAKQLWQLAQSQGAATGSDVAITLRLAQHELAQMLGASRQRINEQLKRLERLRALNVATGRLELQDLGALQRWAQQGVPG